MLASCSIDFEALFQPGRAGTSGWRRMPAIAGEAMVATSHPLSTRAGIRALERGGNAVDAALAAAAVLTVAEPTDNGIGGDAFALVWDGRGLHGINGSGRSPAELGGSPAADDGPCSVTVPGAVRLWADLASRFGRFGLDAAVGPAADLARDGVVCTARIADKWARSALAPFPAPAAGERYRFPDLARTLRRIAAEGPDALYDGDVAAAIAAATWLAEEDVCWRTGRSGSSRFGVRIAGSRSASCRRTARARRRCSRSRSTTGSSRGCTPRSRR